MKIFISKLKDDKMTKKINKVDQVLKGLKKPEEYPGFLLLHASNIWYRYIKNELKHFGTTYVQFSILSSLIYLSKEKEHINQKQIAQHARIDIMMTSDVLKTLESKKLVIRYPNQEDRRSNSIKITEKGATLISKIFVQVYKADVKFFQILGDDIKSFTETMEKLIRENYDNIYADSEKS
jgi:DNA-binding MarR family transcriptional regulator